MDSAVTQVKAETFVWRQYEINGILADGQVPVGYADDDSPYIVSSELVPVMAEVERRLLSSSSRLSPPRVLLVGEPGSGKSAMLRAVARRLGIDQLFDIPCGAGMRREDWGSRICVSGGEQDTLEPRFRNQLQAFAVAVAEAMAGKRVMVVLEDLHSLSRADQGNLLSILDPSRRLLPTEIGTLRMPKLMPIAATANETAGLRPELLDRLGPAVVFPVPTPQALVLVAESLLAKRLPEWIVDQLKLALLRSNDGAPAQFSYRLLYALCDNLVASLELAGGQVDIPKLIERILHELTPSTHPRKRA